MPGIRKSTWIAAALAATVAVGAGAVGIAGAVGLGNDESTPTDSELARASRAALAEVGPATVTDAQRDSAEPPAETYTVDARLPNGVEVAVQLDEAFTVVWVSTPSWRGAAASVAEPRVLTAAELASVDRTAAGQAALAEVGSGTVTDFRSTTALDHAFEVEVTLENGTTRVIELTERKLVVRSDHKSTR